MNATRKIALLLAVVFLLPALFFSGYELSSLNKDEAMIQEVYHKQLEAILFSVNQYSDDVLSRWLMQVESGASASLTDSIPPAVNSLLQRNAAIAAVMIIDSINEQAQPRIHSLDAALATRVRQSLTSTSWQQPQKFGQLMSYKRSGFQKVETLETDPIEGGNYQWLIFIIDPSRDLRDHPSRDLRDHPSRDLRDQPSNYRMAGILIEPEVFVEDMIGPRLQSIARDQFVISVHRGGTPVYNTAPTDSAGVRAEALTREFWLLPDYALGIRPKGPSLQQVIDERTTTNIILLVAVDLALVLAVVLVFRNVRKEVRLAQNKSDFVSNVSHEIRTPLALISMFAETLELDRVPTEEKKKEYYGIIHREAHRLSGIVNKILNFSQAEAKKKLIQLGMIHPDTEIREVLKTYDFHLSNKGFTYTFNERPDLYIRADREAFVEVVSNLIDNAIKYSQDVKKLEINCRRTEGYGIISIRDHGVGISHEDQKHVFDKFYRVSSGNLAKTRGTGLGLSLVKQLMDAQHGTITLYSEPGKGSTFTLSFPLEKML